MKTTKLTKKLDLNKKTITNLEEKEMNDVKGAGVSILFSCACSLISCEVC